MEKEIIMKYRDNLVNYGRRVCTENPARLNDEQLHDEIEKCSGVKCLKHIGTRIEDEDECVIFVRDVKEKSDAHKNR